MPATFKLNKCNTYKVTSNNNGWCIVARPSELQKSVAIGKQLDLQHIINDKNFILWNRFVLFILLHGVVKSLDSSAKKDVQQKIYQVV